MELIPAIDIIEGRCVRLSQGDYEKRTTYDADPVDMARRYADCGVGRIHVVDLDGAKASQPENLRLLERMAYALDGVGIEWGGGIKSAEALHSVFDSGAEYAVVGSVAALRPDDFRAWLKAFGPERMVLGADAKDGKVAVNGWLEATELGIDELVGKFTPDGLSQVVCTDISRDGMLAGPNAELYTGLQQKFPEVCFTVSGGVSSMADIRNLASAGLKRAIIGKAIYEGKISLKEIEQYVISDSVKD